jgi:meiotically up-regulated gene 157 (Mug157) protein
MEIKNNLNFGSNYVLLYMNTRTALTDTNTVCLRGYRQLLRVRVYTDTRFRPYDDECDRTPV